MTTETILRPAVSHEISVSGTAAENSTKFKNSDLRINCASTCYIKLGYEDTVTATTTAGTGYDLRIPASETVDINTGGAGYISIILDSGSDTAYITEWSDKAL